MSQTQFEIDARTFLQQGIAYEKVVQILMRHDLSFAEARRIVTEAQNYVNTHPQPAKTQEIAVSPLLRETKRLTLVHSAVTPLPPVAEPIKAQAWQPLAFLVAGFVLLVAGVLASLGTYQTTSDGFTIYVALIFIGIASVVYGIMGLAKG